MIEETGGISNLT